MFTRSFPMPRFSLAAAVGATLALVSASADANEYTTQEKSGDIASAVLVLGTYGVAFFKDDKEGERQLLRSTGASLLVNTLLRGAFNETSLGERPNGKPYGFPSGHMAFVTSSAWFLQDRYGWEYSLPAFALVGYVGYIRYDTDHHYWYDLVAGAAVSYGISKLFVTPLGATHIAPVIGPDWLGMRWERSF